MFQDQQPLEVETTFCLNASLHSPVMNVFQMYYFFSFYFAALKETLMIRKYEKGPKPFISSVMMILQMEVIGKLFLREPLGKALLCMEHLCMVPHTLTVYFTEHINSSTYSVFRSNHIPFIYSFYQLFLLCLSTYKSFRSLPRGATRFHLHLSRWMDDYFSKKEHY